MSTDTLHRHTRARTHMEHIPPKRGVPSMLRRGGAELVVAIDDDAA